MAALWNSLFYKPILNSLVFLYKVFGNNFGLAIITLTLAVRAALIPLVLPTLRSTRKLKDLQPELENLKKKHKDRQRLQKEQLKLYKQHGVNPTAGCLPFLLQFLILIALYRVFINFIQTGQIDNMPVAMEFLWLNLAQPDSYYVLPVLAGLSQFFLARMMQPKNQVKTDKKQDEDMSTAMQKQMIFMMPIMTIIIGVRLPAGLALYWLITNLFSLVQQKLISKNNDKT